MERKGEVGENDSGEKRRRGEQDWKERGNDAEMVGKGSDRVKVENGAGQRCKGERSGKVSGIR